jgi:transcriptional regulator with XRE-family HTH domain
MPHQQEEVRKRKAEGQSVRELGRSCNVSPSTISWVRFGENVWISGKFKCETC